jgi:hypothetical protein
LAFIAVTLTMIMLVISLTSSCLRVSNKCGSWSATP